MAAQDKLPLAILKQLAPFKALADTHLEQVQAMGRLATLDKGKILFKRGAPATALVFLIQGSVDLADASFKIVQVPGGSERARMPLDEQDPFAVTAVTTSPVRVFVVPREVLAKIEGWRKASDYQVGDITDTEEEGDWMSSLLSSAMFAAVPPANIQQLFARFEEVTFGAGAAVITQGEPGDYFYAVKSGRCRITRRVSEDGQIREVELAEIGVGDVFGEDALIGDAPRNATVTMITAGSLMRLGQADFEDLLQNPVLEYIDLETFESLRENPDTPIEMLDVRLPAEFRTGHLPHSRNLPLHVIRQNLDKLDPDSIYVLTCDGGRRSILASYILNQEGFDARVLKQPPDEASSAA
ncbi:MAG TPA: cyclic nucleotide-binding domain-containing protein [Pseudomonadales bacterium]|nr:cyclic nucleotide-binding domain-containing protein [Pseudomonadales bacterium]